MQKLQDLQDLQRIAEILIDDATEMQDWIPALEDLTQLVEKNTFFRLDLHDIGAGATTLESGIAISPTQAAMCMKQISRTVMFIRGVHKAILQKMMDAHVGPIKILYAGCGPYAILVLPLLSLWQPQQISITLIEINQAAFQSAKQLFNNLHLLDFVHEFLQTDASTFKIPADEIPHIILSETMSACLANEPFVTIARNLVSQAPQAILIPQSVIVQALLINGSKEHVLMPAGYTGEFPQPERDRVHLGDVFAFNKQTIFNWQDLQNSHLPANSIQLPSVIEQKYVPELLTHITVFDDLILTDYDSSLTYPRRLPTKEKLTGGERLDFIYQCEQPPGLLCSVVRN